MYKVILSDQAGFCYGVRRAFNLALENQKKYNKKIYTLGPLIHNNDAIDYLKRKNIFPLQLCDIDNLKQNDVVIIRSHGVSRNIYTELKSRNVIIIDATCPNVSNIHDIVKKYYDMKYQIIIVGDKEHPEVKGINGWCENGGLIVKNEVNVKLLKPRVCIVSQTTEKIENWEKILDIIIKNCKEVASFGTICNATKIRQKYADDLSKKVDMMLVVGGKHSSNTTKLYQICKNNCKNTFYIENVKEIPKNNDSSISSVGVTAGASTPDWIIREVINQMEEKNIENSEKNEQLKFMEANDVQLAVGDVLNGKIISITKNELYVDLGYKSDGILPKSELCLENNDDDLTNSYNIGDTITAKVVNRHNDDGFVVLSTIELEREKAYEDIKKAYEEKSILKVIISSVVKGGTTADYKNVRIFIPASQIEVHHVDDLSIYLNKQIEIKIIEYANTKRKTKIIGSHRVILDEQLKKMQEKTWESIDKGQIVSGEVRRITNFGAFINIGGVDGLLHISELSYGRVKKVEDVINVGDKIKVYVLEADKENKKLSLSIKKLAENPWVNVDIKYPAGNIVLGKVVRFTNFGVFVELEPGVDGLVHISEISYEKVQKAEDVLKIGEMVKAKILNVNKEQKRISLSIKEVNNN